VRDELKREVIFDLNHVLSALHGRIEQPAAMALAAVYHNLLRMWSET
jgi:predicted 2-oxoglutarate/Fe(II)-dependent dioxygenase YbiX